MSSAAREQDPPGAVAEGQDGTPARFVLDRAQRCSYLTPAAERLTRYSLVQLRWRPFRLCIHHPHPGWRPYPAEECPIARAIRLGCDQEGEDVFVDPDGHFLPVHVRVTALGSGGRAVGFLAEVRDLTDDKRREAEGTTRREGSLRAL